MSNAFDLSVSISLSARFLGMAVTNGFECLTIGTATESMPHTVASCPRNWPSCIDYPWAQSMKPSTAWNSSWYIDRCSRRLENGFLYCTTSTPGSTIILVFGILASKGQWRDYNDLGRLSIWLLRGWLLHCLISTVTSFHRLHLQHHLIHRSWRGSS